MIHYYQNRFSSNFFALPLLSTKGSGRHPHPRFSSLTWASVLTRSWSRPTWADVMIYNRQATAAGLARIASIGHIKNAFASAGNQCVSAALWLRTGRGSKESSDEPKPCVARLATRPSLLPVLVAFGQHNGPALKDGGGDPGYVRKHCEPEARSAKVGGGNGRGRKECVEF